MSHPSSRVIAYVPYWDQDRGFASAEHHLGALSTVSPWWYSLDDSGEVVPQHAGVSHVDPDTVARLRAGGVRVIPTISNHRDGEWDNDVVGRVLADPVKTAAHLRSVVDLVVRAGYDGIDIDYENVPSVFRGSLSAFLRTLSTDLHANGRSLAVDVHPKTSDHGADERNVTQDYRAIGAVADEVRVMTYDYHWSTSEPGPVSPIGWVDDVMSYTVRHVPRGKVIMGIPLFGYDWLHGGTAEPVTWDHIQALVRTYRAAVTHDARSQASWFAYLDREQREHRVWFDGTGGLVAKLRLARMHRIAGAFLWRLGGESPETWPLLWLSRP